MRYLLDHRIRVGDNRIASLICEVATIARTINHKRVRTRENKHDQLRIPNLIRNIPYSERQHQIWISDIKYIPAHDGWF